MDRQELRAARRADASGSGPTLEERDPARFPGATGAFALFGEVLLTGLLITVAGLPVVTLPAALAAGIRHLHRHLNAEQSHVATFWREWRAAFRSSVMLGVATAALAIVLTVDITLANSGVLPGCLIVVVIGWVGLVAAGTALLVAAAAWSPEPGWRTAYRSIPTTLITDPLGVAILAAAVILVGVITWMLTPLVIAGLGCAALAAISVPVRRRRANRTTRLETTQ
jgi:uncharacterized membrane protein YesL